ncbi:exonuclease domain-containing protein [Streptomyces sp. NPDC058401]|uniref:exonuclease domain-containing protein n=1 Tax=Streptomyces sp. NPDC058401 TaxID=3346480 RepID=UPI0036528A98
MVGEFASVVNPQRRMAPENQEYHGIGNAEAARAPRFEELAGTLIRIMHGAVVVAHHLDFEAKFLAAEFRRAGIEPPQAAGLCTLKEYRAHTEMIGYKLSGIVKSLSGSWPLSSHAALEDARQTARILTTLIGTAPVPLTLTAGPAAGPGAGAQPQAGPDAVRVRPRVCGLRKGEAGWLAHLHRALPMRARTTPDPAGAAAYSAALAEIAATGRVLGRDAEALADLASAAGHGRESLRAAHVEVWEARRAAAGERPPARELRALAVLAGLLAVPELAERLPATGTELKGVRIVPLGADPQTLAVAELAERHGAVLGVRPSKTTRMVILPAGAAAPPSLRHTDIPVLAPAEAEAALRDLIGRHAAPPAATRPRLPATTSLVIPGADVADVWRRGRGRGQGRVPAARQAEPRAARHVEARTAPPQPSPRTAPPQPDPRPWGQQPTERERAREALARKAAVMLARGFAKREVAKSLRAEGLGYFARAGVLARARKLAAEL